MRAWTISIAALWCGCAAPVGAPDPADAAVEPAATLSVPAAWWSTPRTLRVVVALDNSGPEPLSMEPAAFTLDVGETQAPAPGPDPASCTPGARLEPGAVGRCVLDFEPTAPPLGVRHGPTERWAAIDACSPSSTRGLCPYDSICVDGACALRCSETRWDGACVYDAICAEGGCRPARLALGRRRRTHPHRARRPGTRARAEPRRSALDRCPPTRDPPAPRSAPVPKAIAPGYCTVLVRSPAPARAEDAASTGCAENPERTRELRRV